MKKSALWALLMTAGLVAFTTMPAFAQEEEMGEEYAWGSVVEVGADTLTVLVYDDEGTETSMVFKIGPDVELDNLEAVSDLSVGDFVGITYMEEAGENVVISIMLDDMEEGDEE